jgi:hypothetical protein
MVMGYRGHPEWRDMSEYVVHFVRGDGAGNTGYWPMMGILSSGEVWGTGPFGAAKNLADQLVQTQLSACFSETPLDLLARLVERRQTKYGLGFHQQFIIDNGGARVWYLDQESPPQAALRERIRLSMVGGIDQDDPLWKLTPFVDTPTDDPVRNRFEWEREWRVPGGLRFGPDEVAFLLIPEELHGAARNFFAEAQAQNLGPAYFCPYLDPDWDDVRIQQAVANVSPARNGPVWDDGAPEL